MASRVAFLDLPPQADTRPLRVSGNDFDIADEALPRVTDEGCLDVTLDFKDVRALSNRGLERLAALNKQVRAKGGRLTLLRVQLPVWVVLTFTGLADVLEVQ
jgi:anti-anti-sigma factor